jgi:hypothetical protein
MYIIIYYTNYKRQTNLNKYKNIKINILFFLISLILTIILLKNNINPLNTEWLYNGSDLAAQQIGWYFFKNDYWRFPLGLNPNYGIDIGNTIIYSDSIPILAIVFKFLSKTLQINTSINFQYFSFWYYLCFYLQLYFSYKIFNYLIKNSIISFIGSLLILFSPVYLFRISHHGSLVSHWILLACIYLLIVDHKLLRKISWLFLIIISSLIHLYFTFIIMIFYLIFLLNKFYLSGKIIFNDLIFFFIIIISLYVTMYVTGYFEIRYFDGIASGYGQYKLNLLSAFDPGSNFNTWSYIMPDIKLSTLEEAEGFNYFGLGSLIIIILSLIIFISNKSKFIYFKKNYIFIICSFFFTLIALSNKISFGNVEILNIELNKYILAGLSIFRASGRFFWPVYYLILIFSLVFLCKNISQKKYILLISTCLIIQIIDISGAIKNYSKTINKVVVSENKNLNNLFGINKYLISTSNSNYNPNFSKISYLSEKFKIKKTNVINLARVNRKVLAETRYEIYKNFYSKKIDNNTIYVVESFSHLRNLQSIFKDELYFYKIDNIWLMTSIKEELKAQKKIQFTNFKKINLNYNYKFNNDSKDNFLGLGWSYNNIKSGIWSDGYISSLLFNIDTTNKDLVFEINCEPYLNTKHKNQDVEIYYNNILIKKINFEFDKTNNNLITFELKKELIDNNNVELRFNFKNPGSPSDYRENPDSKKLGILLKNISVKEKII